MKKVFAYICEKEMIVMSELTLIDNANDVNKTKSVKEELLYVPIGQQEFAISNGAFFNRKSFFDIKAPVFVVSPNLDENKARVLSEKFGEASKESKEREATLLKEWKRTIESGDNFDCLRLAKKYGFPKNERLMEKVFLKFKDRKHGDYPISWEHLCEYIPEFANEYGQDKYLELHRIHNLCGDLVEAISQSRMKTVEKYFMYFVYEIDD